MQSTMDPNSSNSSSVDNVEDEPSIVPVVMLCLLGVIGNAIAVTIVCCAAKSHRWRPFYRLVCGLALTDGIGVLLALPFAIHRYATDFQFTYSRTVCDYMSVVQMFTIIASAMIVCTMSLERFVALLFPYVYKSIKKGRRSMALLFGVWAFSAFLSSGHLIAGRTSRLFYPDSWCFVNFVSDNSTDLAFAYLYALTGLLVLVTTFVTNMALLVVVFQKKCSKSSMIIADKHGTHIILFLFAVVLLFSICILPILVRRKSLLLTFSILYINIRQLYLPIKLQILKVLFWFVGFVIPLSQFCFYPIWRHSYSQTF